MKRKTILSFVAFVLCFCVFMSITFAWITLMNTNESNDALITPVNKDCNYHLYYYDDEWIEVDLTNPSSTRLVVNDFSPNDIKYFKLTISPVDNTGITCKAKINSYSSTVSSELQYGSNVTVGTKTFNDVVYTTDNEGNNVVLYQAVNNVVTANNQTLYNCVNNDLQLSYYKIEDKIELYQAEMITDPDNAANTIPSITGDAINFGNDFANNIYIPGSSSADVIFGLKFTSSSEDPYYQFQKFIINGILIVID